MAVQPDGKIVVAGEIVPGAGGIARLNPDGSLDTGFGEEGFVIDRRLPNIRALALQPDGRIVAAAVGGFQLARYLPDGTPDPSFADPDPSQVRYAAYGPTALVVRPDGGIVLAGAVEVGGVFTTEGWVTRYDSNGGFVETVGRVPLPGGPTTASGLHDLLEEPDGSLIGVGWGYGYQDLPQSYGRPDPGGERWPVLARFVPGSGTDYDPGFGNGAGLVRPPFAYPYRERLPISLNAVAASGDKLLLAGETAGTFLLARFHRNGELDTGFGERNGYSAPFIYAPGDEVSKGALREASTWANDLVATGDGAAVLGGGTSQWSEWAYGKMTGMYCTQCPQPMLARFDSSGHLDPSFGSSGLLRLSKPDGSIFMGEVDQVVALADGKLLVKGHAPNPRVLAGPFVARLNPDGTYDRSFGEDGAAFVRPPCTDQPDAELRRAGCFASGLVTLHLKRLRKGRPALFLRVRPSLASAGISSLRLTLPKHLRLTRGFKSKLRVSGSPGSSPIIQVSPPKQGRRNTNLLVQELGSAPQVRVQLRRGSLSVLGKRSRLRKLPFRVKATFTDSRWGTYAGDQTLVRRAG
ncbi:MAG: delta-60 repeat domain-containing protein [Actinomycetota bacterium]|nr:delta-60 repeat domain-containing protein [Actinomycetota bacterium]